MTSLPGPIETWRMMNTDPLGLFQKVGVEQQPTLRRHGLRRFITLSHPDHLEHVLTTHSDRYEKGPILTQILRPYLGNGLLTSHGDQWRRHRKIISPAFRARNIERYTPIIIDHTDKKVSDWREAASKRLPINMAIEMSELSLQIVCSSLFSETIKEAEIADIISALQNIRSETRLGDILGLTGLLPRIEKPSRRRAIRLLNDTVLNVISRRRASNTSYSDLLDQLITAKDNDTGEPLPETLLVDEIKTLFIAGYETTAVFLTWAFYNLALSAPLDALLNKEIKNLSSASLLDDLNSGRFREVENFLSEILRLYPPVPVLSRRATVDDAVAGVNIPRGALIDLNIWLAHRHPDYWQEPDKFNIKRFDDAITAKRHKYAYLPFGGGARICIGKSFALQEAPLILIKTLQAFKFEYREKKQPHSVGSFILQPKDGLRLYPSIRQN
ncbi:MAG: cytochrome P450 [Rhodobacteraceae bacterium]|nr:cytochrome P450 [Paracoccaceae bacterium]